MAGRCSRVLPTIQGTLEEIVGGMEGGPVQVPGSGRTDAGVHALEQVAAFSPRKPDSRYRISAGRWNRLLPPAIRVLLRRRGFIGFSSALRREG